MAPRSLEQAVHWVDASPEGISSLACRRVYFGSHTCELLMPSPAQVRGARRIAREHQVGFSLVSPWLTDAGLRRFLGLLDLLESPDEVVVNDWGLLRKLSRERPDLTLVAGLLLTRDYRDPRATDRSGTPRGGRTRPCFTLHPAMLDLLRDCGAFRLEINAPQPGFAVGTLPADLHLSIHGPASLLALTRRCAWREAMAPGDPGAGACPQPCRGRLLHLTGRGQPTMRYVLRWNSWFTHVPDCDPAPLGADRLVTAARPATAGHAGAP